MIQSQLDRAVAQATGESVSTIQRLGFRLDLPQHVIDESLEARFLSFVVDPELLDVASRLDESSRRHGAAVTS